MWAFIYFVNKHSRTSESQFLGESVSIAEHKPYKNLLFCCLNKWRKTKWEFEK